MGELSKDFAKKKGMGKKVKKLIPVIFSHGNSSNRTLHSAVLRNLASCGYLVFAIDH